MKLRSLSFVALACLTILSMSFNAPTAQRQGRETTALGKRMREFNGILRQLGKAITDESMAEENATKILRLQTLAVEAKSEIPVQVGKLSAEDKAEAMIGYRVQMNVLLSGLIELEDAVLKNETKKAEKALRALNDAKGDGHAEYKGR